MFIGFILKQINFSVNITKKIASKLKKWGDIKHYKNEPDFGLKFLLYKTLKLNTSKITIQICICHAFLLAFCNSNLFCFQVLFCHTRCEIFVFQEILRSKSTIPLQNCLLYTSPSPRDGLLSRMPSSA